MRSIFSLKFKLVLLSSLLFAGFAKSQFGRNNLAVLVAGASATNTTVSVVEINKTTSVQAAIQTISIPGTGVNAIRVSGSASSTLYAANNNDRSLLCFTGHNDVTTGVNANTLLTRAVVTVNNAGTVSLQTTYTGTSGNQTRGATSINNTNWFVGDQGGFYTNGSTAASPAGNIRSVKAFGGIAYGLTASATTPPVGVISAPSGGTYSALPGLPNGNTNKTDFYLVSSANNNTFDILYTVEASSATVGIISKYSLVSGSWVANGTYTTTFGGFSLAAEQISGGANLYVTTGTGASVANSVVKLVDAAGYNSTISITTANNVTLFTTASGTLIKGLTFAPMPTVSLSVSSNIGSEASTSSVTVTVTSTSTSTVDETVSIAVSGTGISAEDYNLSSTTITIPAGSTSGSATFTVVDDILMEGTETATLTISNPSSGFVLGGTITQGITITDNDLASVVITPTSGGNAVTEGGATDSYSVTLSTPPSSDVIVSGTPNSQVDISPSSLTFTSSNWNSPQTVTISAINDNIAEGIHSGSISYAVTSADFTYNGIAVTPLSVSITDNDFMHTVAFAKADTTIAENGGTVKIWLKVTTAGNAQGTIDLSLSNASNATNGSDFTIASTTLTIPANAVLNQLIGFDLTLGDDSNAESDEYLICQLTNANGVAITSSGIKQHTLYIRDNDSPVPTASNAFTLTQLSSFSNGASGTNSAEISAYCSLSKRLFIANSVANRLDILNYTNPSSPTLIRSINLANAPFSGSINSVYIKNGNVALALEGLTDKQANGKVVFVDTAGAYISEAQVGAMPDMVVFNHAGTKVLTANEGEPNAAYTNDPEGSISIIDISAGVASPSVTNLGFSSYNSQVATLKAQGIRIFGLNATVAQDFEPEYITISPNDSTAWVTLQENNALAEINLFTNTITKLIPLGYKDHSLTENAIDASDNSFGANFSTFPVKGMYLPDAIAHYSVNGVNYLVTANEGDSRAYSGFTEESRISGLTLDATAYPNASEWKNTSLLGRLNATTKTGDTDGDGDIDQIHVYGSRSFSIWNPALANPLVYDSKNELEKITFNHPTYGSFFNMSNTVGAGALKNRSDDKGPEPEGVAIGKLGSKTYAFIALERIGGVMVYDISNPTAPQYVTYINNRQASTGDRGAEGIIFIDAASSPNGLPLVVVSNEVSSTVTTYQINCLVLNPTISAASNSFCPGSSTSLSVTGISNPASYIWSNGATSSTITTGDFGSYTVSVTDANGCTYSTPTKVLSNCDKPDLDNNGITDVNDFVLFVPSFGLSCSGCTSDFNHDGLVNVDDFLLFAPRFNQTCSCAP